MDSKFTDFVPSTTLNLLSFHSCFISNVTVFFAAFLGPILLILAFNAVIFIVVIAVLIKHVIKRSSGHSKKTHPIQLMTNIISVIILFGLTWIFGALTIMKAAPTFQIVFTLLNSFQGFLIFIIFCVLKKEIRSSWTQIIKKCGYIRDMRSSVHSILTISNANTRSTVVGNMDILSNADRDESIFTEEMKTLGPNVQLTRTLSLHKRHMEEVVKVSFDEVLSNVDTDESIFTEEIKTLGPNVQFTIPSQETYGGSGEGFF